MNDISKLRLLALGLVAAAALTEPLLAFARTNEVPAPLYPTTPLLQDKTRHTVYPSVAGNYLVYTERKNNEYSVVRVPLNQVDLEGKRIKPEQLHEAIRFGVAVKDGAIGYVSNRMGPLGAWMRQAEGDGHIAIANMGTVHGALMPENLRASTDGRTWCFDSTMQNERRSRVLGDFNDGHLSIDLVGQSWRMYNSDSWMHRVGYHGTKPGTKNDFEPPALFVFNRDTSQLMMFHNAFDGAMSPDGRKLAFVREVDGNYDLWMQNIDGTGLTQLTRSPYGDFEPAFSPDGKKIAFISNRDSDGDIEKTAIYVMDLTTGRIVRITNSLHATDGGPVWKDAHTLIFHSNRDVKKPQAESDDNWNLWQVDIKGAI
jgi:hypothetical protein